MEEWFLEIWDIKDAATGQLAPGRILRFYEAEEAWKYVAEHKIHHYCVYKGRCILDLTSFVKKGETEEGKVEKEYWYCIIGPIYEKDMLPRGSDAPLRDAVQKAFMALAGCDAHVLYSGWGISEAEKERMLSAGHSEIR